jgi:succinoglycan biosynthesis transport protein ExoP
MVSTIPTNITLEDRVASFKQYAMLLWQKKHLIVAVAIAAAIAGYYYTKRQPPVYRTAAKMIVSTSAPQILPELQQISPLGMSGFYGRSEYLSTQYEIIRGSKVAKRVAARLGLIEDAEFLGFDPKTVSLEARTQMAVDIIRGGVRVDPMPNSMIVFVWYEDTNPERAMRISNAVAQSYVEQNLDVTLATAGNAESDLGTQLDDLETSLKKSEQELLTFRKENVLLAPRDEGGASLADENLYSLKSRLDEARRTRKQLELRRARIKELEAAGGLLSVSAAAVLESDLITQLKQDYIESQRDLLDLKTKYLEKHPAIVAQEEKVQWLKENLDREIKNILDSIESDYRDAQAIEKSLEGDFATSKNEVLDMAEKELRYHQLKRKVEDDEKLFGVALQRYREIGFTKTLTGNNVEVIEEARTPKSPYKPNIQYNTSVSFVVGLIAGIALVLLLGLIDSTLKNEKDAELAFGVPFLGPVRLLPHDEADTADLYVHHSPQSPIAEDYRAIRTSLLFSSKKRLHTLLVTSANPQEGKTTTALNIGVTMANAGGRTLIVDADMYRPRIHQVFDWENDRGLTALLLGEATVEEVVRETVVKNLFILPCGIKPPNPSEIIGSERFAEVLEALKSKFDRVIFDSPPVVALTDAVVLSTKVDGVVIVARAGATKNDAARQTGNRLRNVSAPILGVVMNAVDYSLKSYGYNYSYNRYGYYSQEPEEKKKPKKKPSK